MNRILPFLIIATLIAFPVVAQEDSYFKNPIPLSPNAAALGKYGNIPVSLHTGIPEISIPIHTLRSGQLTLPISLNYHASGLKVDEIPGWTGAGWSIQNGGLINREVRGGFPDELPNHGFYAIGDYVSNLTPPDPVSQTPEEWVFFDQIDRGHYDLEPDMYNYSYPGGSGKFMVGHNQNGYYVSAIFPVSDIKIDVSNFPNEFTITDEQGTIYEYDDYEEVDTKYASGAYRELQPYRYNSSWFLTRITSVRNDVVNLLYDTISIRTSHVTRETNKNAPTGVGGPIRTHRDTVGYMTRRLVEMSSDVGRIEFFASNTEREDLSGDHALDEIKVYDSNNNLWKRYDLSFGYFGTVSDKRLRLDSIKEFDASGASKPSHVFEYNGLNPPAYGSQAQDSWGYYNGKDSNTTLIPEMDVLWFPLLLNFETGSNILSYPAHVPSLPDPNSYFGPYFRHHAGADRSVDPVKAQAGILTKINYPTGGYTTFLYETNDVAPEAGPAYTLNEPAIPITKPHWATAIPSYVTEHDRSFSQEYDYRKLTFGNVILIDSTNFQEAFGGDGPFVYQEQTITVNHDQWLLVRGKLEGSVTLTPDYNKEYGIKNSSGTKVYWIDRDYYNIQGLNSGDYIEDYIFLDSGSYTLYGQANANEIISAAQIRLEWLYNTKVPEKIRLSGGLRIKEIQHYADQNSTPVVKRYQYRNPYDTLQSSGVEIRPQNFSYLSYEAFGSGGKNASAAGNPTFVRSSHAQSGIEQTHHVLYEHVTVLDGINGEYGKTVYSFLNPKDVYMLENVSTLSFKDDPNIYPFPYQSNFSWAHGLLTQETSYAWKDGVYTPVIQVVNNYDITNEERVWGYKLPWRGGHGITQMGDAFYMKYTFPYTTGYAQLKESTTTNFDELTGLGSQVYILNEYTNPAHRRVTKRTVTGEEDEQIVTQYYYALDSLHLPDVAGLINANKVGQPIEQITWQEKSSQKHLTGAQLTQFGGDVYADTILTTEFASPLSFSNENTVLSIVQPHYSHEVDLVYDNSKNIRQTTNKQGRSTVYIWGYSGTYPVVKIDNINVSDLPSGVLGTIEHHNYSTTGALLDVKADVQFLRDELVTVMTNNNYVVSTYTYLPGVGLTSETDANGITTYYEYDQFDRLTCVRDDDENILKTFTYDYKQN